MKISYPMWKDWWGQLWDTQPAIYDARGTLAYRPGHLRARWDGGDLHIDWTRRGADISESWALPDAENSGKFQLEFWDANAALSTESVLSPEYIGRPPWGASEVRVAEIGLDGRVGAYTVLPIPVALP